MAVSNDTIIGKMMEELQKAKQQDNQLLLEKHISRVQLLCDLILQEATTTDKDEISPAEMKAMIEGSKTDQNQGKQFSKQTINHEEANGGSIFDF